MALATAISPPAFSSVGPARSAGSTPAGAAGKASAAGKAAAKSAVAGAVRAGNFLGVTFGFPSDTLHPTGYTNGVNANFNLPMYNPDGNEAHFWDSYVEQLQTSGVDFVAPTIRGTLPTKPQYNGGGDTTKLADLVAAIKRRGAAIKISALDDTAASLTGKKNLDKHGTNTYDPKFDVGDAQGTGEGGYKYFWEYNLENWFKVVPADLRFTLSGRPVIYEWSLADSFFTDQGSGHAAAMLDYAKQHAQSEFGVAPYFIVDNSWIKEDPAVQDVVDGVNDWFSMTSSSTLA